MLTLNFPQIRCQAQYSAKLTFVLSFNNCLLWCGYFYAEFVDTLWKFVEERVGTILKTRSTNPQLYSPTLSQKSKVRNDEQAVPRLSPKTAATVAAEAAARAAAAHQATVQAETAAKNALHTVIDTILRDFYCLLASIFPLEAREQLAEQARCFSELSVGLLSRYSERRCGQRLFLPPDVWVPKQLLVRMHCAFYAQTGLCWFLNHYFFCDAGVGIILVFGI